MVICLLYSIMMIVTSDWHVLYLIGDVMVHVLASSAKDRGCDPRWGKTKDY